MELKLVVALSVLPQLGALANVKTLKGLRPICARCNKVRDESGDWHPMEVYIKIHSDASFSHGICPECRAKI